MSTGPGPQEPFLSVLQNVIYEYIIIYALFRSQFWTVFFNFGTNISYWNISASKESNNIHPRFGGFSNNFGFWGLREFLIPLFCLQV